MTVRILEGDALTVLRTLPDQSVQMCVTSPPYFGLRDYGVVGQLGLEKTPQLYVDAMVGVFSEVKRVLRDDGTLWLNVGDSYAGSGQGFGDTKTTNKGNPSSRAAIGAKHGDSGHTHYARPPVGYKAKDLFGIPWLIAFALRSDGWYLRQEIIWAKANPMPESVTDRCTKSHEHLFLLSKCPRYYFDSAAIAEPAEQREDARAFGDAGGNRHGDEGRVYQQRKPAGWDTGAGGHGSFHRNGRAEKVEYTDITRTTRNKRSVWTISTQPFRSAHFATFPPKLIEPCILAGSARGDTVLDPFMGAGTTGLVADRLGRDCIGIELNPKYAEMARRRIHDDAPLFAPDAA